MEIKYFEPLWNAAQNYRGFIRHLEEKEDIKCGMLTAELRIRDVLLRDFQSVASPESVSDLYELAIQLQQQVVKLTQSLESTKRTRLIDISLAIQLPQSEHAYINGVGMRILPYNATLAAIERAGYTATEAPL